MLTSCTLSVQTALMSADLALTVAAEVRAEMGRQGWSHQRLAAALGTSRQAAGRRITGEIAWDVAELEIIAAALGVPVSQFMPAPASIK